MRLPTSGPPRAGFYSSYRRFTAELGREGGFGTATCRATMLEGHGPLGCPLNSVMGYGTGLVEVPFGPETVHEGVRLTTFMAPLHEGHLGLLFYAEGWSPAQAPPAPTAGPARSPTTAIPTCSPAKSSRPANDSAPT
jgi:hypothetical protein